MQAGLTGLRPADLAACTLAEFWDHVHGHGLARGWWQAAERRPTKDWLAGLIERVENG